MLSYSGFAFDSVEVAVHEGEVVLIANPDGLVGLARLFLDMACSEDDGEYAHLLPTLQLSPESVSFRVIRNDQGLLPNGKQAPGIGERVAGLDDTEL